MTQNRRTLRQLERLESMPAKIPPSLEEAFAEIEQLDARHPEARGTNYGAIRTAEARANRSTLGHDGR